MKTAKLGKIDRRVSRVGIGGIPIVAPSMDEAVRIIQRALDLGVNFIDTSFAYGDSEERFGRAIAGRRDQLVIATKTPARDKKTATEHIETSLKRLGTSYIDLWQFHGVNNSEDYEKTLSASGVMEAAHEALKAGKINYIGVSTHTPEIARKAIVSGFFDAVQYPFNFVNNDAKDDLVPLARKNNVGFIAMKPFAGGRIKDAKLALKYLLQFDNVLPDPGVKRIEEVAEIVDIVNGSWKLTREDQKKMDEIRAKLGTKFCQYCSYCLPCPQQIDIPVLMNALNIENYSESFVQMVARNVDLASNCIQCGSCEKKCPFRLPIRKTIAESIKFFEEWSAKQSATKTLD